MRITDNYIYNSASENIDNSYEKISDIQAEISTGIRVDQANKDPESMAQIMLIQNRLDEMSGSEKTATTAKDILSGEQSKLSDYTKLLQNLLTETKKIANGTYNKNDIEDSAVKYQSLLKQLVSIANAKNTNGDSYFAGTKIKDDAYSITKDSNGDITNVSYNGNDDQQTVNLASGVSINLYESGNTVFGSGQDSIFNNLISFIGKLKSGSLSAEEAADEIKKLNDFSDVNSKNSTTIANNMSYADFELKSYEQLRTNLKAQLGNQRDADYTKVVTELSQQTTLLKATMSASLKLEKLSIFE